MSHQAQALEVRRSVVRLLAADHELAGRGLICRSKGAANAAAAIRSAGGDDCAVVRIALADRAVAPGIELFGLERLVQVACRERDTHRVVRELVHEHRIDPPAGAIDIRVQALAVRVNAASADRDDRPRDIERTDRAQVNGTGKALADQARHRRLVDVDLVDDFSRVLVVFDGAVVAGRSLLAPVQQGRREVRREAADRDDVAAAGARCDVRPGRREIDLAMDVSGSLPMSSAEMDSTIWSDLFFVLTAF